MRDVIYLLHQYTRISFEKIWVSLYKPSHQSFFFAKQREFRVLQDLKRKNQCINVSIIQRFFINVALRMLLCIISHSIQNTFTLYVCRVVSFLLMLRWALFSYMWTYKVRVYSSCAFVIAKYIIFCSFLLRFALLCRFHQTYIANFLYTRLATSRIFG